MASADATVLIEATQIGFEKIEKGLKDIAGLLEKATKSTNLFENVLSKLDSNFEQAALGAGDTTAELKKITEALGSLTNYAATTAAGMSNLEKAFAKTSAGMGKKVKELKGAVDDVAAQANRFVSGNLMAQFQDVIVSAQMGMRPLTIAMQQGTQILAAFVQSKNVLADLVAGFKSLISPVALLTVGLTGLVAAGIQMVDWTSVAKGVLNGLANVFEFIGNHITELIVGFTSLIAVELTFNDVLRNNLILSLTNFAGQIKNLCTLLVANFVPAMKKVFSAISTFFTPIRIARTAVVAFVTALSFLGDKVLGTNVFNKLSDWFRDVAEKIGLADDSLKNWNNTLDKFKNKAENIEFETSLIGLDTYTKAYRTAARELQQEFSKEKAEKIASGASDKEIAKLEREILNIDELAKKIATLTDIKEKKNNAYRDGQKAIEDYNRALKNLSGSYDNLALTYQTKIQDLNFKNSLKGMSDEEKIVARINNEYGKQIETLERKAAKDNIDISKFQEKIENIEKQKNALIDLELQTYKNEESQKAWNSAIDYGSSLTKTLFSDMKSGLQEGQSAWEAFTNAVLKMLDKITDKMMDLAIDAMFDSLKQGQIGKSSGGNLLNGLMNVGSSLFSSGSGSTATTTAATATAGSEGFWASIGNSIAALFAAKGGAFTNGIYKSPTVFTYANGGKFGVMGEAGPEAVIPLHRSSDGSLGVRADGIGGGSPVVVNVINNSNARAITQQRQTEQGTTIDVMIDELVAQKLGQQGTASNQALTAFNNRQLVAR